MFTLLNSFVNKEFLSLLVKGTTWNELLLFSRNTEEETTQWMMQTFNSHIFCSIHSDPLLLFFPLRRR